MVIHFRQSDLFLEAIWATKPEENNIENNKFIIVSRIKFQQEMDNIKNVEPTHKESLISKSTPQREAIPEYKVSSSKQEFKP